MAKGAVAAGIVLVSILISTFFVNVDEGPICYWEISERTGDERHALNWIFEPPEYSSDPDAAVQMAKYASLMGYDYIGTSEYNDECGLGCHGYWASNTMYGVIDWVPDDPRTVCLRANENEEFPCFISWRIGEDRDPSTLSDEERLRYLDGELMSYWIDVQRDDVIDMYVSALEEQPCYDLEWDQVNIIYFDEFTSSGYSYINEDYELVGEGGDIEFRCHECHEDGGVDECGHDYSTVYEGRLVMEARMIELAHEHGVEVIASGGRDWFNIYLPYIEGDLPESEWPYEIPLDRYRAAEPDYFVIEPDLGDPGTQEYEWSQPDYVSAEPYAQRVYAGSPRPGDPEVGIDSDKNVYTVDQVVFRVGYLASRGFWFGPNSESMKALVTDPDLDEETAVKPFLKAIPNWENLNDVSIEERSFNVDNMVYESPMTHVDDGIIYSVHPYTGDFHVVFLDETAKYGFEGDWEDYNVYRVSCIWEREREAKDELLLQDGNIMLKDAGNVNVGYVITKNQYKTMEGISSGPGEIVALVRIGVVAALVLLIAIKLIAWSKSA